MLSLALSLLILTIFSYFSLLYIADVLPVEWGVGQRKEVNS